MRKVHQILLSEQRDDALVLLPNYIDEGHLQIELIILEPDQSVAAFCGNGSLVVAAYVERFYTESYNNFSILAHDGDHRLFFLENGSYGVDMLSTKTIPYGSPFVSAQVLSHFRAQPHGTWSIPIPFDGKNLSLYFTETGEPHLIFFEDLTFQELSRLGRYINSTYRRLFPQGVNINRVSILDESTIEVMTYERGVNRITQSCGTGATSCAILCRSLNKLQAPTITIQMLGGVLMVEYDIHRNCSILKGPASIRQKPAKES